MRWQVELLFKELKSHTNLHRFATRQEGLVKGLIWASLLALVVKRFVLQQAQQQTGAGPLSFLKMASSAKDWLA
ncbi:MAG: transposase, partial [Gammaproteobacteria bacterium]|nr:transposase [Gammaproteobacteria bacterium]